MEKALATSTHRVKIHRTEHPDGILLYRVDDSTTHTQYVLGSVSGWKTTNVPTLTCSGSYSTWHHVEWCTVVCRSSTRPED